MTTLKPLAIALFAGLVSSAGYAVSTPSATVMAMSGEYFSSWGDMMIPIKENSHQLFYTDFQAEGGSNTSLGYSLGGGYRQTTNHNAVVGGYLFIDRNQTADNEYFTVLGPGIESISPTWQYRLNGYIPIGDKKQKVSSGWAQDYGYTEYESFSGHNAYDHQAEQYQTMSYGGDATLGYRFKLHPQFEVDATPYAYNMTDESDMYGGKLQLNFYKDNNASFYIGDGYDNKNKNRVYVGVALNFGARDNTTTMSNLLHAPVYRNLNVNTTSDGFAVDNYVDIDPQSELYQNNIYFIDNTATGSTQDGTYENPYTDVDDINTTTEANAHFWVANTGTAYSSSNEIILTDDQTLNGRSSDYKKANTLNSLTTIYAPGIDIEGDNTISGINLLNNGDETNEGVYVDFGSSVNITNTSIGSTNSDTSFEYGIYMDSATSATISDSNITGYLDPAHNIGSEAYGIFTDYVTDLSVSNSTISANATGDYQQAYGIWSDESIISINNSIINAQGGDFASGVSLGTSTLTMDNSTVNASSDFEADAVELYYNEGNTSITNSTLNSTAPYESDGVYIVESDNGTIDISNNTMNISADTLADGVYVEDSSTATSITDNIFNIESSEASGTSNGIYVYDEGNIEYSDNINNLSGNTTSDVKT